MFNLSLNKSYFIWLCTALFYVYQFVLRVSPSLIVDDLMISFHLDASGVATLSALAMYSYALMQIPAGLLIDRCGVRRVFLISVLFCLGGLTLFAMTKNLVIAQSSRVFLGLGSASAFLCVSKISTQWFPSQQRCILLGMTMAMGTVGGYLGNNTLSGMISHFGWRNALLGTDLFGIIVLALGYAVIPKAVSAIPDEVTQSTLKKPVQLLKQKEVLLYAFIALGMYLCISVVADLWGVNYLVQALGIKKQVAVKSVSLIYVGLCVGSLFLSFIGNTFRKKRILIQCCLGALLLSISLLVYFPYFSGSQLKILFFMMGFFSGAEMLCFSHLCDRVGKDASGTATGLMNCIVMLGGAFMAEQVGKLLDLFWKGETQSTGVRMYSLSEYQTALSGLIIVILISFLITILFTQKQTLNQEKV